MTKVRLCFHDRCFDGTASAALFYRFYRERFDAGAEFGFTGMTHRAAQPWEPGIFDGDENAIVDFKFSNSPKVTWWFDHHQSAFLTPADAEQFRKNPGPHMFYEPDYKSCTKLIATVAKENFGFDTKPLEDLIHWGDIIDGAQYPTAEFAVGMAEPAMQLALVIEAAPESGLPAPRRNGEAAASGEASGAAAGAAPEIDRDLAGAQRGARRSDFFRCRRPGSGRLQQIHPVPAASGKRLFRERERFGGARQSIAGDESVEPGDRG